MRIDKISLTNFTSFKHKEITFAKEDVDLHIIEGGSGVGKTNFVRAVKWCLFGAEFGCENRTMQNSNPLEDGGFTDGETSISSVSLNISSDTKVYELRRSKAFVSDGRKDVPAKVGEAFTINLFENGEQEKLSGARAIALVNELFPNGCDDVVISESRFCDDSSSGGRFETSLFKQLDEIKFCGMLIADAPFDRACSEVRTKAERLFLRLAREGQVIILLSPDGATHDFIQNHPELSKTFHVLW